MESPPSGSWFAFVESVIFLLSNHEWNVIFSSIIVKVSVFVNASAHTFPAKNAIGVNRSHIPYTLLVEDELMLSITSSGSIGGKNWNCRGDWTMATESNWESESHQMNKTVFSPSWACVVRGRLSRRSEATTIKRLHLTFVHLSNNNNYSRHGPKWTKVFHIKDQVWT